MNWKELTVTESEIELNRYFNTFEISFDQIQYQDLRECLKNYFYVINNNDLKQLKKSKYLLDIHFGYELYSTLAKEGFSEYEANNDNIWRYLSVKVLPDLVNHRWEGTSNIESRFYKTPRRIWLKTLWWYIHLSLQMDNDQLPNKDKTLMCLEKYNTDTIVQLTERRGKYGYNLELTRTLMWQIINCNSFEKNQRDLFRKVMIFNTAKSISFIPKLHKCGIEQYVEEILNYASE